MRSTKNEKPHKRPQPLIASFFGGGPPKPARKPMITTPEKVVLNRCNSRLSVVTSSKSAFDEFGSSDTSFGSPEVQNFKNPVLSKWSKSASENGLPECSRPKTNMKEELLDALGLNDKENVVPTNYVVLKEEQLIDMHASTIKKEAIASLSQFQVKKEASSDTPNTEETVTPLIKELEELNRANPNPKKQVKIEELKVVNNDFVTDRTLDTKHNKETVAKPKLSPIKKSPLNVRAPAHLIFSIQHLRSQLEDYRLLNLLQHLRHPRGSPTSKSSMRLRERSSIMSLTKRKVFFSLALLVRENPMFSDIWCNNWSRSTVGPQ